MLKTMTFRSMLMVVACALSYAAHAMADEPRKVDVPPGELTVALRQLAEQSGVEFVYSVDELKGVHTGGVRGEYTAEKAVTKLLEGTKLRLTVHESGALLIAAPPPFSALPSNPSLSTSPGARPHSLVPGSSKLGVGVTPAQSEDDNSASRKGTALEGQTVEESQVSRSEAEGSEDLAARGMPEVLVKGTRSLNTDIARKRDDAQPYVVFDRRAIEASSAVNLEAFFKERVSMNTVSLTNYQNSGSSGNKSSINLRGLGPNQTLVLVDGHRIANFYGGGASPTQGDLNSIPLTAIERIEVLPTTASGIYGGGATGGVVNVILRRDYTGMDLRAAYKNVFEADAAGWRLDLGAGWAFEEGKTHFLLAGSYADANSLAVGDRHFLERGRTAILANRPANLFPPAVPPLGATTNIRSVNGSPLFGPGTPSFTSVPAGYAGGGGLAPLLANAGTYNLDAARSAQGNGGANKGLVNGPTVESLIATVRRRFGSSLEAFLEAASSRDAGYFPDNRLSGTYTVAAMAPNNPFGQAIQVTVPIPTADGAFVVENESRRLVGGVIVRLPASWHTEADYIWSRLKNSWAAGNGVGTSAAAVSNGTLDVLRDINAYPLDFAPFLTPTYGTPLRSTLEDFTLRVAGPVRALRGGPLTISALAEYRDEQFSDGYVFGIAAGPVFFPERSQSVESVYLEAKIPLISSANDVRGFRELELQIAGRHDRYTIRGATGSVPVGSVAPILRAESIASSTDPMIGLRYRPFQDVILRASFGTGFLPPSVNQLTPAAPLNLTGGAVDPRRGNEPLGVWTQVAGGNPLLRPEESKSWAAGLVWTPNFVPDFRVSVDYVRIKKTDDIANLGVQQTIDNETVLPGAVTRAPVQPGDPFGVGRVTAVDISSVNVAQAEIEAYDVSIDYRIKTSLVGTFDLFALATSQPHFKQQLLPTLPVVENAGVGGSVSSIPLKFKASGGLTWSKGQWALGWNTRYFDSYLVSRNAALIEAQGNQGRVRSQIYHDFRATYRIDEDTSGTTKLLAGTEIQLGVNNVLNREPSFDASFQFLYSGFGDPSLATYHLSVRKRFH